MEFTAVIFCGHGNALTPFSKTRATGIPKALLPIANKPMITYVLDWCQSAFFNKIIILSQKEEEEELGKLIENYKFQKKKELANTDESDVYETPIEIFSNSCENSGEVFYKLLKDSKFKSSTDNFIALPCDLITNLPPQVIIERFRNKREEDLGIIVSYKNQLDIEDKKSKIFGKSYTIYSNEEDSSFLDLYSKEEVDQNKILQIRMQMCQRFPNSTLSTKLLNSGIFLGSKKIFDIIDEEHTKFNESYFEKRNFQKFIRDLARRSWKHSSLKESIGFLEVPSQATFFRVNKLQVWIEANRYFMKQQAMTKGQSHQQNNQKDKSTAHVGNDSTVGENTTLGEKTNIKRSVIGSNCKIGNKVKITGSLILDNTIIEDDVQLDNCIIGHDVIIHSKSKLINCNVESTNEVPSGTQSKGDTLLCLSLENLEDGESEEEFVLREGPLSDSSSEEEDTDESEDESEFEDEYTGNDDGLFDY